MKARLKIYMRGSSEQNDLLFYDNDLIHMVVFGLMLPTAQQIISPVKLQDCKFILELRDSKGDKHITELEASIFEDV